MEKVKEEAVKRIYRDADHKMIAGICAGIGELLKFDPTLVRLALVFFTVFTGFAPGIIAYAVGWFIIPLKEDVAQEADGK
jgi:phage shock protein PspC (stress-responsive transcriptional regulator)